MSAAWKEAIIPGAEGGELPSGYARSNGVIGRSELLSDGGERRLWSDSRFVARSQTAHTTSSVEARIQRRHLERLFDENGVDRAGPVVDLGCADGTLTHDLLDLGFEQLVSTDLLHETVAILDAGLDDGARDRVMLVVDDMLKAPFGEARFATVIAWGVLSLTGDFETALERAWSWVRPGGHMLVAEPLLEQALAYPLVRGDAGELRRVLEERTRASMWDRREQRYPVSPVSFYEQRLPRLAGAEVVGAGGISMLPSLLFGGLAQDAPPPAGELEELADLIAAPDLDDVGLWRQAFWLLKRA